MHLDRCLAHHVCAGVYIKQVLCASAYTFAYTLATGCAYALMYLQFVHSATGNEGGGFQLVCEGTCCRSWGIFSDKRRDRGVVCVFSIFNEGRSEYGCMCVYTHTVAHTDTAHMEYSIVSTGVRMRHLEGPKESRWNKSRNICIRICVQSTHVHVYHRARRWDEILD